MKALRTIVQALFLGGVTALLIRGLMGLTSVNCEYYCPFGGVVALYPLLRYKAYTCALTEFNTALLVSVLVLAVASKKSFCGWVCPVGTLQEWIGWVGKKVFRRRFQLPASLDRVLLNLRYVVLVAIPVLTFTAWKYDLGFRAFDPFYILFTWGGHGTAAFSVWIVVVVLAAALFVPFLWCRYLCPMGAALDPFSRLGALRLRRNRGACTDCGLCDSVCPHRIPVSQVDEVTARNCTNCLDCVEKCPAKGALELTWFGK
jgi:polyferredoxin